MNKLLSSVILDNFFWLHVLITMQLMNKITQLMLHQWFFWLGAKFRLGKNNEMTISLFKFSLFRFHLQLILLHVSKNVTFFIYENTDYCSQLVQRRVLSGIFDWTSFSLIHRSNPRSIIYGCDTENFIRSVRTWKFGWPMV